MILLNDALMWASPWASTTTLRFFELDFAICQLLYLVTFFLLATVLRFPLRVLELFLVR
jgi:hypothetical protein